MARDGQVVTHLNLPCEMEAISTCACAEKNYLSPRLFHNFLRSLKLDDVESALQEYPAGYTLYMEDQTGRPHIQRGRRPILSDGGSSRVREQQTDTDSAEPPSLTDSHL